MRKIEFKNENNSLVIYFYGDVDNQACSEYKKSIIDVIEQFSYLNVILDFSNVTFIDSSGIGLILGRYKQLKNNGTNLSIRGTNKSIDKLFNISGLWSIIKKEEKVIL